ncbi:carbon-nitrogen hydrolase family protein [Rhizohabitans arisaemae]|uniref:carbon-nitrogen hydrolase family protein n=1 Tax=Rhizohabitans arisaemae TaxID=2720610 RepID=UPI0024B27845|nr:carbon-nitrogen hydrolase family protein [Rhizohabitans arisaemae]
MTRIALCQTTLSDEPKTNLGRVREALARASDGGAELAIFPEATLSRFHPGLRDVAEPLDGPFVSAVAEAARAAGTAVILGTFEPAGDGRVYNTSIALDASGALAGSYRKIHLFDSFGQRESELVAPGDDPVTVEVAGLRVGLITCYDIRFPELARALMDEGAELLAVIAAWGTGVFKEEHWVTLVRARAIENTVWTAAVGMAADPGRPSVYGVGRSMLVDPLGVVAADLGPYAAVRVVETDPELTKRVRSTLPSLEHRRLGGNRS